MKLQIKILCIVVGMIGLSSCSTTRYVPDGERLLKTSLVQISNTDKNIDNSAFVQLQKQRPNARFLGIYPLKLKLYGLTNETKQNAWHRFWRKAGEPPVVFDSTYADQSVLQMEAYLMSKGHFSPQINYECVPKGKRKVKLIYRIETGPYYRLRKVELDVRDDSLKERFRQWESRRLIQPGQSFDLSRLDRERNRIVRLMQNEGYYYFNKEHLNYEIDSSLNAYQMDVKLIINKPDLQRNDPVGDYHRRYPIEEVYIYPDLKRLSDSVVAMDTLFYNYNKAKNDTQTLTYHFVHGQKLTISPYTVTSRIEMTPGDLFRLNEIERTYENLVDMRVYQSTNVHIQDVSHWSVDSSQYTPALLAKIEMMQGPIHNWTSDVELTTSSSWQGSAINTAYQNKNLFGGAEIFNVRLRGAVELQYLLNKEKRQQAGFQIINNFDIKLETTLEIPRFLAPVKTSRFSQSFRPRTIITAGYNYQLKPSYYQRTIVNAAWGYVWRQKRITHTLFPLDINSVKINQTEEFAKKIDTLSQLNKRLKYQYDDHLIFAARYNFLYNEQQLGRRVNFNMIRASLETSGNFLYLISTAASLPKSDENQYQLLGLAFSQYVRFDVDAKRHWYFKYDQAFVLRTMFGAGISYGNSKALPYEKGFFAGGTNNIRAWPLNLLGPGSYYDPTKPTIERVGDIVFVANAEYRFPVYESFKGAFFVDAGNIWLRGENPEFLNGNFKMSRFLEDLAIGSGLGVRWDLGFFVIRLDAAFPLRDPAKETGSKWVVPKLQWKDIILNFGIGYPF